METNTARILGPCRDIDNRSLIGLEVWTQGPAFQLRLEQGIPGIRLSGHKQ